MIISIIYAKFNNTVFPVLILVISTVSISGCDMIGSDFAPPETIEAQPVSVERAASNTRRTNKYVFMIY